MKKNQVMSMLLGLVLGISALLGGQSTALAAVEEETSIETMAVQELTSDEFKSVLIQEGYTEQEAAEKIASHTIRRVNPEKISQVTKTKTKSLSNGFKLKCKVTVYVWRSSTSGENLEIDHAAAPYVSITGNGCSSTFSGNQEATTTTKKVTVDYNGDITMTVSSSIAVNFGVFSYSVGSNSVYVYDASGSFTWKLSEI